MNSDHPALFPATFSPLRPELLAPAGDKDSFLTAINSGADAIYLGLQKFNARARAKNFTLDELRELVPYAQSKGVKVLVTLNILLKETEFADGRAIKFIIRINFFYPS